MRCPLCRLGKVAAPWPGEIRGRCGNCGAGVVYVEVVPVEARRSDGSPADGPCTSCRAMAGAACFPECPGWTAAILARVEGSTGGEGAHDEATSSPWTADTPRRPDI